MPHPMFESVRRDRVLGTYGLLLVFIAIISAPFLSDGQSFSLNAQTASRLKVCKIAGPGVALNTLFRFTVSGIGALNAAPPDQTAYGAVSRTVDVRAGDPAQGGTCQFVPGVGANAPGYDQLQTFVNGTGVTVVEDGLSPDNQVPQSSGQLRTAQIRVFGSSFAPPEIAGFSPNPDTVPTPDHVSRAVVIASSATPEVEFSGFRFNPTVLKVCNVASTPGTAGTQHQFTVALVSPQIGGQNPGPMFPNFTATVTVSAGTVGSQEGNCSFVNGSGLAGGAFNQGSSVTVTQTGNPVAFVSNIYCPSCPPGTLTADLVNRRAFVSGSGGISAGINSVVFVTGASNPCAPLRTGQKAEAGLLTSCDTTRLDFDGDGKADPALFNSGAGAWSFVLSMHGGTLSGRPFGIAGDIPVPDDYDGDRKSDVAVWRPSAGRWYFVGTSGVFEYYNWGESGDIPQVGDFDGDGTSDFVLFRPSNTMWYIRTRDGRFEQFQFGISTDEPVAADYDGDGRTDAAVFRNGTWYVRGTWAGFRVVQFGQAGDVPVPRDYDGDGRTDFAVFRNGVWYTLTATAYTVRIFGQPGDIPTPEDFDGDGIAELSFYRLSERRWYIRGNPGTVLDFGSDGDLPANAPVRYFLD